MLSLVHSSHVHETVVTFVAILFLFFLLIFVKISGLLLMWVIFLMFLLLIVLMPFLMMIFCILLAITLKFIFHDSHFTIRPIQNILWQLRLGISSISVHIWWVLLFYTWAIKVWLLAVFKLVIISLRRYLRPTVIVRFIGFLLFCLSVRRRCPWIF